MEVNGNYIFTLRDAMTLASKADRNTVDKTMYESAVLGNYVLTPKLTQGEASRKAAGIHAKDSGEWLAAIGVPSGKTVNHISFSNESPYSIPGLKAAQGGVWGENSYTPSKHTIDRYGTAGLADYFQEYEKGVVLNVAKPSKSNGVLK